MWLIFGAPPQVLLCNGPGTCIPLCLAAFFARVSSGLHQTESSSLCEYGTVFDADGGTCCGCQALFVGETVIVYIESIARVQKLSLSGQILYTTRLADLMLVQVRPYIPGTNG
eukprot:scaffold1770_cov375-Prasinococcus_capsulatus_cf.AAC.18